MLRHFTKKDKLIVVLFIIIFLGGLYGLGLYYRYNLPGKTAKASPSFSNLTLQGKINHLEKEVQELKKEIAQEKAGVSGAAVSEEEQRIKVVKKILPSVVSIVETKQVTVYSPIFNWPDFGFPGFFFGGPSEKKEEKVSSGTGFLISSDGMILTNKHVVADKEGHYTVITNDNKEYSAKVLVRDPVRDLALLKIQGSHFQPVTLGDSSKIVLGETVICIGNALGQFQNTVSVGVISGLSRQINAAGAGTIETLNGVIQTDAAINPGNSGGPMINLQGKVIGINVAMAQSAQNIGFAIPINQAKRDVDQFKKTGKIVYPFLGIRYITIDKALQEKDSLPVDYGALIVRGEKPDEVAVVPGSTADKMGLKENDIILKINGQKIDKQHLLGSLIQKYQPGDKITLEILRHGRHLFLSGILGKRES